MTYALLPISLATLYAGWRLFDFTFSLIEGRCICRKGGWMPNCPVHGRQASAGRSSGEAMQANRERGD